MKFNIVQKFNTYWEVWSGPIFAAGPFETIIEARDWMEKHSPKEFETQSFYKKPDCKGNFSRRPGLFERLANLD